MGTLRRRGRATVLAVSVCVLLVVGLATAVACSPVMANHFGYALPTGGLPSRIVYVGRYYGAEGMCVSPATLQQEQLWPLHEVGQVPTLLGAAHPLLGAAIPPGQTQMVLFVAQGPCYESYALHGGP